MVIEWALHLREEGLACLTSTVGESSRALRVELRDEGVDLVTLWRTQNYVSMALEGTVLLRRAPAASRQIDRLIVPKHLNRRGSSYPQHPYPAALLNALTAAYEEASAR
jgi:hypothetical protein